MNAWQPIETAPKDGTLIITSGMGSFGKPYVVTMRWDGNRWFHVRNLNSIQPTHWMPLPEPPKDL